MIKSLVLFVTVMEYITSLQACEKSCNNNGICYIENGIEKCKCLDRIYVGERCDELVNYCNDNPCQYGSECIHTPGQYNCLCKENFYGQNCTFKSAKKYFGQIYLQYNHVASISHDNYFLIIITDLGTVTSMLEISTWEYAIAGGLTFPSTNSKDFIQTNDIQGVAKKYNLSTSFLPSGNVFYYIGKYRMSTDGIHLATFTVTDASNYNLYYIWYFQFGSIKNAGCNPVVKISNCGQPKSPVRMNVNQSVFVEAYIQRDCGRDSRMSYKWSISNYFDTTSLQTFDTTNSRSIKIPAYGIQIKYDPNDHFYFFKVLKLISMETSADGKRYGTKVNRVIHFCKLNSSDPIFEVLCHTIILIHY